MALLGWKAGPLALTAFHTKCMLGKYRAGWLYVIRVTLEIALIQNTYGLGQLPRIIKICSGKIEMVHPPEGAHTVGADTASRNSVFMKGADPTGMWTDAAASVGVYMPKRLGPVQKQENNI